MKALFSENQLKITIERLAEQLIENHGHFNDTVIIGLQPRGVHLSDRIYKRLKELLPNDTILYGKLDITFYRDDFKQAGALPIPTDTEINFSIEGKNVVLVDDVLYTGRSVRAGLDALLDYGRAKNVELLVLIDRSFSREVPIQPNYVGHKVDVVEEQKVKVRWKELDKKDEVVMI